MNLQDEQAAMKIRWERRKEKERLLLYRLAKREAKLARYGRQMAKRLRQKVWKDVLREEKSV